MIDVKRWRGLRALLETAVEEGSSAVERVHMATARRPFEILKQIPPIERPVRDIQTVHDAVVSGVYNAIRSVNHLVGEGLDGVLTLLDEAPPPSAASHHEVKKQT
jgi:hypothetical protein